MTFQKFKSPHFLPLAALLVFAGVATWLLVVTHAATPAVSFEAEAGTRSGNASVVSDSGASGGAAVKFTTASSGATCVGDRDAPGGPDGMGGCWPGPQNTGYPHGLPGDTRTPVTLRVLKNGDSGSGWYVETVGGSPVLYITQAGTVLDSVDVNFYVHVMANNVTIKRSRITNGGYYSMFIGDLPTTYSGLTLEDVELDGTSDTTNFVIAINSSENATFRRINVHNMASSGPRLSTNTLMEDSWIHDFAHGDGGHEAGLSSNGSEPGIVLRHNNISINTEGASSAIAFYRDFGTPSNELVEKNLLNGGNYCTMAGIAATDGSYPPTNNIRYINNTFGRMFYPECGRYFAQAQFSTTNGTGNVWSGNIWGAGAAATSAHQVGDPVNP